MAYAELSPVKQHYWHLRIAEALEEIHVGKPGSGQRAIGGLISSRLLSRHARFRSISALLNLRQRVYANDEAIGLLRRGLQLLHKLPDQARHEEQQLNLLRLLSLALVATRGYACAGSGGYLVPSPDIESTFGQADPTLYSCGPRRSLLSTSATFSKDLHSVINCCNWPINNPIRSCWSKATMYWG